METLAPAEAASQVINLMLVAPVLVTCGAALLVALFRLGAR